MDLKDAYSKLKTINPLLKPLAEGSPLWKKVVLEYFKALPTDKELKKAVYLVAISLDDDEIYKKYFSLFYKESDDDLRKFMVESLKDNVNDTVIDGQFSLIGIKEFPYDRYVRQIACHNLTVAIKTLLSQKPFRANVYISRLCVNLLNDENTFTRMNAAIILRNIGHKRSLKHLEERLRQEKKLLEEGNGDIGIPYVIREIERSIAFLKERS